MRSGLTSTAKIPKTPLTAASQPRGGVSVAPRPGTLGAYLVLSKARLSALVLLTTGIGYGLAPAAGTDWLVLAATLLGTTFAAFGVNAINQVMEIERDARMLRTRRRPLPAGTIRPAAGLAYGLGLALAGPLLLLVAVNPLTALLSLTCEILYVAVYTPLKTRTPLNTLVGAVCGAIPPMMGWAAAAGTLGAGAWVLAAILFIWQIPHFLALAWMHRDDYRRGGFHMLPIRDADGQTTCQTILVFGLALIPVTLMLTPAGVSGPWYAGGALLLGMLFVTLCAALYRCRQTRRARGVFLASVIYLPLLMGLMVADRRTEPVRPAHESRPPAAIVRAAADPVRSPFR